MLSDSDRTALITATEVARQRLAENERDALPEDECDPGPEHISTILDRLLVIYTMCGVIKRRAAS